MNVRRSVGHTGLLECAVTTTHSAAMTYNSLYVPLDIGTWQCTLVPANDYYSRSGRCWDSFANWDEREKQRRQIEDDCRTFDRYFRPNYDFRRLFAADIDAITSFLCDQLNIAHWNLPTDNAGIERVLKQAVADGKLVPIVDRERRLPAKTFRPTPAPLSWPPSAGAAAVIRAEPYLGGLAAMVSRGPALVGKSALSADDNGGGLDWLGVAAAIGNAAVGGGGDPDMAPGEASTPLSDARAFEYSENAPLGDVQDLAARFVSEAHKADCFAQYERDLDLCNALGGAMGGTRGIALCKTQAFQNYQQCRGY